MHNAKPTHLKLLACAVMSVALGCGTAVAQTTSNEPTHGIDRSTQTSGPTGTPATTGDGGSADTTGAIRSHDEVDGGMAGMNTDNDTIDAEDFLEEASAKGVAEIETGQKALE